MSKFKLLRRMLDSQQIQLVASGTWTAVYLKSPVYALAFIGRMHFS